MAPTYFVGTQDRNFSTGRRGSRFPRFAIFYDVGRLASASITPKPIITAAQAVHGAEAAGARRHRAELRADGGVDGDGQKFQHEEDDAQQREARHVVLAVDELREEGGEDQDRLGVAGGDQEFLPRQNRDRRPAVRAAERGERRRSGAQKLHAQPDEIGRARPFDGREQDFRGHQQRAEAERGDRDHDGEGDNAAERGGERDGHALARAVGQRQQVVGAEGHVQREAGGNEPEDGLKRHLGQSG